MNALERPERARLNAVERWVVRNRKLSACLLVGAMSSPWAWGYVERAAERDRVHSLSEERALHGFHDRWVKEHSGEIRSVCRREHCSCDQICDRSFWYTACTNERIEVAPNGDVLCKVP